MTDSSSIVLGPPWVVATASVVAFSVLLGSRAFEGTDVEAPLAVTYAADIAPIIARGCVSCHSPDGWAPFSLLTYEDVRSRAERIAVAAEQGVMPPWLAGWRSVGARPRLELRRRPEAAVTHTWILNTSLVHVPDHTRRSAA
jgi:hypothetical protein